MVKAWYRLLLEDHSGVSIWMWVELDGAVHVTNVE